ncbi:MAG: hypothetical protein IKS07_03805 [Lachnospiraceae bacterium]|nr:hypothetical protein [Lachnospiraceae bacterium]
MKKIYWHLPGFSVYFYMNQVMIHLMQAYPDAFREGYAVGSVYGTFPGAIWNGGRAVFGCASHGEMEQIIATYNRFGVPVRFTWTNPLIEEKHLQDTYCNLIMETARGGKNQVLVNSPVLEEYLRKTYPDFAYISSTTKRLTTLEALRGELGRDYALVVLDYDLNHDEAALAALEPEAERIEILVDEICFPKCPKRAEHYRDEGLMQLRFERAKAYPCPNREKRPTFAECKKRPAFIDKDEIASYAERGFVNFKLVGRGLPPELVKESYLYYLPKEEKREFVREKLETDLAKLTGR